MILWSYSNSKADTHKKVAFVTSRLETARSSYRTHHFLPSQKLISVSIIDSYITVICFEENYSPY